MATITGFMASRMQEIEDTTVVDGNIVGNNLILLQRDGTPIDAGNVRGPTGSPGVTEEELEASTTLHCPVGTIVDYISLTPPEGWLLMDGSVVVDGETLYPALWAVLPDNLKEGSDIVLPNAAGRVSVAHNPSDLIYDLVGDVGGQNAYTLLREHLPAEPISINPPATTVPVNPPSTAVTGSTGTESATHTHGLPFLYVAADNATGGATARIGQWNSGAKTQTDTESTSHTHAAGTLVVDIPSFNISVDIAAFNSENLGSGTPMNNRQAFIIFQKILKAV